MKSRYNKETTAVWNIKESQFPKRGKLESQIKFVARYALLAPSGHNSQPWKFKIGSNFLEIYPDLERKREEVDPFDRELYISLGCAVKNAEVAAEYFGLIIKKDYLIDIPEQSVKIRLVFLNGSQKTKENSYLFKAITKRLTNRSPFDDKKIDEDTAKKLMGISQEIGIEKKMLISSAEKKAAAELVYKSNKVWFKSKELVDELHRWLSNDVDGFNDEAPSKKYEVIKISSNLKDLAADKSDKAEVKALRERENAMRCAAILVLTTKQEGIETWIKCGELYEELALEVAAAGLSLAFFNTVVELKTQREKLALLCGGKVFPQLMFRIGYTKNKSKHTPRRGLEEITLK